MYTTEYSHTHSRRFDTALRSPARPASELVEPPLEGGVEAEVVDELLEALLVLALCEIEGDLDLRLGGQTQ